MSWFENAEQKRKLLVGGTIIICLAMLAVTARRYNVSFDSHWHLQIGLDWLERGLSPWRDHYSFTYYNQELSGLPVVFEVLIAWLVIKLGLDAGLQVYMLSAFFLAFGLVVFFLRKLKAPVVIYCTVLPLLVVLLQLRAIVRPELISFSFIVLAVVLYHRGKSEMSAANMLPIIALMLVWSNYHTPIFGYVIFFGYFIDLALRQISDRAPASTWMKWLGWGLAVFAVGFLHPGFKHSVINMLFFSSGWKNLISEYQSSVLYLEVAAIYSLIAITLFTVVLLLRHKQYGLLFVCSFLTYHSVDMVRLVTPSGIVILCIFAWMLSEHGLGSQLARLPRGLSRAVGGTVMVLFILSLSSSVTLARAYMEENRNSWLIFPKDVVDYMIDQDISGRIYNAYNAGGYLIHRLSPDSQVYIDGRTNILYPIEHFYRQMDAERSAVILREEIEKYDINLALLNNDHRFFSVVHDTGILALDYVGAKFSLFRKDNPNFPTLGTLLAYQACWNPDMYSALQEEQTTATNLLPASSSILPYLKFVVDYSKSTDRTEFLNQLDEVSSWSGPMLRFAGHQALIHDLDSTAYELFGGIKKKEFGDYLGGALAKVRLGEWKVAEETLDTATRLTWSENPSEISVLHGLLVQIRQNATLELFDDAYVNKLAGEVGAASEANASSIPDPRSFCPDA